MWVLNYTTRFKKDLKRRSILFGEDKVSILGEVVKGFRGFCDPLVHLPNISDLGNRKYLADLRFSVVCSFALLLGSVPFLIGPLLFLGSRKVGVFGNNQERPLDGDLSVCPSCDQSITELLP